MGLLDIFNKNSEIEWMLDLDLFQDTSERIQVKQLAMQTCTNLIARTLSQSEFRFLDKGKAMKNNQYYAFNVAPNRNTSASRFWHTVVDKLVYENRCLIIENDTGEMLVADSFERIENANYEDSFKEVTIKGYTFQRTFYRSDVAFIEYNNKDLSKLLDSVFKDYGELLGKMLAVEGRKGQLRSKVKMTQVSGKDKNTQERLQSFINRMYKSVGNNDVVIFPEQPGFEYEELSKGDGSPAVENINKLRLEYLDTTARALGIPPSFARGEVASNEDQTKNFIRFCIKPLAKKIEDEFNATTFSREEYLSDTRLEIRTISHRDLLDLADAADKLRSSSVANGHEVRDAVGLPHSDDPIHDKFLITKNYEESDSGEGGENE